MREVGYIAARSWRDAVSTLSKYPTAKPIAGGSDLLGWIKEEIIGPKEPMWETLVDLRTISDSAAIRYSQREGLRIGALATLSAIESAPDVVANYPLLAKAAGVPASPNIRNVGTLGGNINQRPRCWYLRVAEFACYKKGGDFCFAVTGKNEYHAILEGELCYIVHPSDVAPALLALDAKARIQTPQGEKTVPFSEYFIGPRQDVLRENVLQHSDVLIDISIPPPNANHRWYYQKVQNRGETYDFAIVNIATVLTMKGDTVEDSRIVLSGVAPTPWRATAAEAVIKGKRVDEALARQAADQAMLRARPMSDNAYKVDVAKTLIRRSILEAVA
ncbi:MAG TPA: xanthine dehydrogenase family protein subunit M [Dehalococcoidia bacterium]|nr:xanthine dehydrogenase family protein subunit M [Dehalococcoidia bacterium]